MRSAVAIVVALILGVVVGLALNLLWTPVTWVMLGVRDSKAFLAYQIVADNQPSIFANLVRIVVGLCSFTGDLFIRALRFCAVPIVLFTLIAGAASLGDVRRLGRVGLKTILLYLGTTVIAVVLGLVIANVVQPGQAVSEEARASLMGSRAGDAANIAARTNQIPRLSDQFTDMLPRNPFEALAQGNMLQIIVFALILGIGLTLIPRERAAPVVHLFDVLGEVMGVIVRGIMVLAPVAVFCLITPIVATMGLEVLMALGVYMLCVLGGLVLILLIEYPLILRVLGKMGPGVFYKGIGRAMLVAFSTSSSNATLPVTMACVTQYLRVPKRIASFVCPLGATINMDGTALYLGVASVFVAQAFGLQLSLEQQLSIVVAATLASIGSPGIPGGSLVFLVVILQSIGLPAEGLALVLGVDRLLDMARTVVNVTGDAMVSVIVSRGEPAEEPEGAVPLTTSAAPPSAASV